jgi:(2Fe-2S) ferredoxin
MTKRDHYLFVCQNVRPEGSPRPSCGRNGSHEVYLAFKEELARRGLHKTVARACTSSCLDMCEEGPVVCVQPGNHFYRNVRVEHVPALVQALVEGTPARELLVESHVPDGPNNDR